MAGVVGKVLYQANRAGTLPGIGARTGTPWEDFGALWAPQKVLGPVL